MDNSKVDLTTQPTLNKGGVSGSFTVSKYRKIPIVIMKWNDGFKGWRAEIADSYENYKPLKYDDINFEDLGFHFRHDIETHPNDDLVFSTRKDAVQCAKYCNEKYLGGKAKIWFIS
ncbi:hypothetical protein [Lacihabitans soyangensis]|uniref:Uncharacterized protein n=1 Tax=Lacihabitans soyangensis TaxID=869394 RepID=A0AAE3H2M2_9BACT|nr:hypothetical protein [Lacihabitans soyangensis]MCP9763817.1 hypothetical protein [Lacihabitans soyangensis]